MDDGLDLLALYLHLARASQLRRRPHVRDRLLVLAGAAATRLRLPRIAAYCRQQVLQHNPRHALGHWATVDEALTEPDFQALLRTLLRRYPAEKAEQLLAELGIERGRERETYYSDEEYAAALLGVTPETLAAMFGEEDGRSQ